MLISKIEKINVLNLLKQGLVIPSEERYDLILLQLADDGLININKKNEINLSYFGFKTLEDWDPVLQISINNQLLQKPHGDA